jgi:hypothetical protein
MLPRSCALVLIKLVCIGLVRGMCALVGEILELVSEVTEIFELLWFSPFYGCLTREIDYCA